MSNFLKYFTMYFAVVLAGVKSVEENYANEPGASKQKLVLDSIIAVSSIGAQVPEVHVQAISAIINSVVGTLNAVGIFKKTAPKQITLPA